MTPDRLHVLAVSHAYPTRSNSSHGVFIHQLHVAMRTLGARVDVLQLVEWAPPPPFDAIFEPWSAARARRADMFDELDGIAIHHPRVFLPRPSRLFSGDVWRRNARALARYCSRRERLAGADVVLGHFMVPDGVYALELGRALGIPVAGLGWGDDLHAWPEGSDEWRRRLVEVLEGIDLPLGCSRRMAEDGNAWLDRPRDDWQIVYGGVDLERFSPPAGGMSARRAAFGSHESLLAPDARILLMVGQPVRAKGYVELLDVWESIQRRIPEWHLVMVGGRGDIDIPSTIIERGLTRAHWLGSQPAERMPHFMRAADAFVLPSHNEGLSLSVLEALATGVPTIATDVGGHAEVIQSPDEGWLIPPRDADALRQALLEVTTSADERRRRGAAGRQAAQRIGTPADNAARLLGALSELRVRHPRAALAVT